MSRCWSKQAGSLEYVSGTLSSAKAQPDSVIRVEVVHRAPAPATAASEAWCELLWKGELVARDVRKPSPPVEQWTPGQNYREIFELKIPFCVPAGEYEVRTGFAEKMYANGDASVPVGTLRIGDPAPKAALAVDVAGMDFPASLEKGGEAKARARMTVWHKADFDAPIHVSFWKDGLLWAVVETGASADTSKWAVGEEHTVEFPVKTAESLPAGTYEVRVGLHRIGISAKSGVPVAIKGGLGSRGYKPLSHGYFQDKKRGETHFWYVNQFQALIWDGKPYLPVGGMLTSAFIHQFRKVGAADFEDNKRLWKDDVKAYELLKSGGVRDVFLNPVGSSINAPGWAWQFYLDHLEGLGFKYGIQVNMRSRRASVSTLQFYYPRANPSLGTFKAEGVKKNGKVSVSTSYAFAKGWGGKPPAAQSVHFIVVNDETQQAVQCGEGAIAIEGENLVMTADVRIPDSASHNVQFTPRLETNDGNLLNFWDHMEEFRVCFEDFSSKLDLGPGFRFFVDPGANESHWVEGVRVASANFDRIFADWLKAKYGNVEALNAAWRAEPRLSSFEDASALVPLYTTKKDREGAYSTYYIHPGSRGLFTLDSFRGIAWDDCQDARLHATLLFNNLAADGLKKHLDVPVVYKHVGHTSPEFINTSLKGGFDGVGSEDYGGYERLRLLEGYHYSAARQFARTAWLFVTETNTEEDGNKKLASKEFGYPSKEYMHKQFDVLIQGGAKGVFDFLLGGGSSFKSSLHFDVAYSYIRNPKMLPWLKEYHEKLNSAESLETIPHAGPKPDVFFYYSEYAGNVWWLKVNSRSAVLPNDDVAKLKMAMTDDGHLVVPCYDLNVDTQVIFANLENSPATGSLGGPLDEFIGKIPAGKHLVYVGLRKNLGALPRLDRYFTGEMVELPNADMVQVLKPTPTSTVLKATKDGKPWALRDGGLWIIGNADFHETNGDKSVIRFVKELGISAESR